MAIKSMSIRIDDKMLNKLHAVADYEGRSANSQILILIRDCIEQFEEKHGKIQQGEWCCALRQFELNAKNAKSVIVENDRQLHFLLSIVSRRTDRLMVGLTQR